MTRQLSLLFLAGCLPSVDPDKTSGTSFDSGSGVDSATPDDTGSAPRPYTQVLLSTIATDYSLGAVATVDIETGEVADALATTSGDAVVRSTGGLAVVLNRFNTDSVRLYDGEDWSQPTLEFALADTDYSPRPPDRPRREQHRPQSLGGQRWVGRGQRYAPRR